jgi:hypothetical protein
VVFRDMVAAQAFVRLLMYIKRYRFPFLRFGNPDVLTPVIEESLLGHSTQIHLSILYRPIQASNHVPLHLFRARPPPVARGQRWSDFLLYFPPSGWEIAGWVGIRLNVRMVHSCEKGFFGSR